MAWPPSIPMRHEILPALKVRSMSAAVRASANVPEYLAHNRCTRSICSIA